MTFQRRPLAARAFRLLAGMAAKLQDWPNRLTPPAFRLLQISSSFWQSRALTVAARLDLATILGDGPLSVAQLAERAQADPQALGRLLRLLAAMGVFEESAPGIYRNTRLSHGLRSDRRDSIRALVLMHNSPEMSRPWFETLEQGVRTGACPFELCHGSDLFDFMDRSPAFDALFAQAMDQVEALTGDSFATGFHWGAFDRILDVGGANGAKAAAILRRHPHLRAVVIDRDQVVRGARDRWTSHGDAAIADRLSFETGDLFGPLPSATAKDVYLLSAVLHCFDDESCIQALRNIAAVAGGAHIAVLEMVMPAFRADMATASFDMQMFMGTRGKERTLADWQSLFERSGVRLLEVVELQSFVKMLVLRP